MRLSRSQYSAVGHYTDRLAHSDHYAPMQTAGITSLICKTGTGGIPARSSSTAGKATDVAVVFIKPDGTMTDSPREITVYNPFGSAVAGSAYITCKFVNNAYWIVDAEDCG